MTGPIVLEAAPAAQPPLVLTVCREVTRSKPDDLRVLRDLRVQRAFAMREAPVDTWLSPRIEYDLPMLRKAFRMSVNDGQAAEYERRHRPIWAELEQVLFEHGVRTYSIFLDEATNDLFAYAEIEDEERWKAIANTDVCRRWWRHMREIMPASADDSPVAGDLREVFHIAAPDNP